MVDPVFIRRPGLTPATLRIVRYAMLAVVLLFGGITYYQSTHRAPDPDNLTDLSLIRWVGFGLCAVAILGVGVLRQVRERAADAARPTFGMIGSALGEAAAMFGAVYMVLGGGIEIYALGLIVFLATWTFLPADSASE